VTARIDPPRPDPQAVRIDGPTGSVSPFTGRYVKPLSDLAGVFHDTDAWSKALRDLGDTVVYEVMEYRQAGSELFFGTTRIAPGRVGDEFYMTRGHFHARQDRGEVYTTLTGEGVLLLETRDGRTDALDMRAGETTAIPPGWAHRTINTGSTDLVFSWVCSVDAGHDYDAILARGMRKLVLAREGAYAIIANPHFD
jgi:glucose-6-phosphate isomerase